MSSPIQLGWYSMETSFNSSLCWCIQACKCLSLQIGMCDKAIHKELDLLDTYFEHITWTNLQNQLLKVIAIDYDSKLIMGLGLASEFGIGIMLDVWIKA